jgi:hypothetical protein
MKDAVIPAEYRQPRIPPISGLAPHRPFLIAAVIYAAVTAAVTIAAFHTAGGHFVYPLDDTYINMAMAKNFAMHGVWGVSPYEFTSSSSSPLYVLLLAALYRLIGTSQYVPLFLSWIFGAASIYIGAQILADYVTEARQTAALIFLVLLTPLFAIGTLGMEHSLHLLLTLLFVQQFDRETDSPWSLAVITALMVGTRYEGMFVAAAGSLLLIAARRWRRAVLVAVAAWLPIFTYALFSISHNGYWLPNSVALKGVQIHGADLRVKVLEVLIIFTSNSIRGLHLFFLLAGMFILALSLRKKHARLARLLWLIVISGCLHLFTSDVGWAFRYEDYLVGAGIIVTACAVPLLMRSSTLDTIGLACLYVCCGLLVGRSVQAALSFPRYSRAIYLQQWQMAHFLSTYYPNAAIAANDVGLINFRSDLHCLDLTGLASSDVLYAKALRFVLHCMDGQRVSKATC